MGRKAAFKRKTTHPFERELPDQRPAIQTEFRNSGIKGTKCIGLNGKGSSTRQNSTPTRGQLNSDRVDLTPTKVDLTPTRVDLTPTKRNFHTTMRFSPQHAAKFEERKHSGLKC